MLKTLYITEKQVPPRWILGICQHHEAPAQVVVGSMADTRVVSGQGMERWDGICGGNYVVALSHIDKR